MISRRRAYAISDALQLEIVAKSGKLSGIAEKQVNVGGLKIIVRLALVSAANFDDGCVVLIRGNGNLGMLVVSRDKPDEVVLHLLDLSKIPNIDGMLEVTKPKSLAETLADVQEAEVKTFCLGAKDVAWEEIG